MISGSLYYKLLFFVMVHDEVTIPSTGYKFSGTFSNGLSVVIGHMVNPVTIEHKELLGVLSDYYDTEIKKKVVKSEELEMILRFVSGRLPISGKKFHTVKSGLVIYAYNDTILYHLCHDGEHFYLLHTYEGMYLYDKNKTGIDIRSAVRMLLYYLNSHVGGLFTSGDCREAFAFVSDKCHGKCSIKKESGVEVTYSTSEGVVDITSSGVRNSWKLGSEVPNHICLDCVVLLNKAWVSRVSDIGDLSDAMYVYLKSIGILPTEIALKSISDVIVNSGLVNAEKLCKVFSNLVKDKEV